jgi:hypothetical protein
MFKVILGIALILVIAILLYAWTRPSTFYVERSTVIQAPPEKIFPLVDDFHQWGTWSPWEKLDPAMQRTFSGPESGKGAGYAWQGNKQVGQGNMQITDTAAPNRVTIKLDFIKPFEGHEITEIMLDPAGNGSTTVKWTMQGPNSYLAKLFGVFVNMDKSIGKDFETGLANLKTASER